MQFPHKFWSHICLIGYILIKSKQPYFLNLTIIQILIDFVNVV